jgi:hypothetical protein
MVPQGKVRVTLSPGFPAYHGPVTEVRECAQCGAAFTPRREHARFCTARCRMAWNREHDGVAAAPVAAIDWSVIAMAEAADRFAWATEWDLAHAAAAVSEIVWWITLVDATLVRYQPGGYEHTLAALGPGRRRKTEETLAGMRYVRNQLGCSVDPACLIRSFRRAGDGAAPGSGKEPGTSGDRTGGKHAGGARAWRWNPMPEPALAQVPEETLRWEMSRYHAYQARLAERDVARSFARCAGFLERAAAASYAGESLPAAR